MDYRFMDKVQQQREFIDGQLRDVNTCLPGRIDSFDPATQTATVTPAVKLRTMVDGTLTEITLPQIIKVPLCFPFAVVEGFALTIPVKTGDPCLLIFAQRCIDNWWQLGGVQSPETDAVGSRHHDLTDAFAICCAPPIPNVLSGWCEDGIEIRNTTRSSRITLRDEIAELNVGTSAVVINSDGSIEVTAPDSITITSPMVTVTGDLLVGGNIVATGDISDANGSKSMSSMRDTYNGHTHQENGDGGGVTDTPAQQQ